MAVSFPPLFFRWRAAKHAGEMAMYPVQPSVASSWFEDGELYRLEAIEERSGKQHRRYFACIREAWQTLPEGDKRFPTPEHLRAYALVATNWYEEKAIPLPTREDALKVAAWTRNFDAFAVILVSPVDPLHPNGPSAVKVRTARSQSIRNMKNEDFKKSSEDVLHWIDDQLSVPRGTTRNLKDSA